LATLPPCFNVTLKTKHKTKKLRSDPKRFLGRSRKALNGSLEGLLRVRSRLKLPLYVLTQMILQFVQWHGSFDASGQHLMPPLCDCLFEVKHVVLSPVKQRTQ
jgi:hypothetical protein